MVLGQKCTSGQLFASSEPKDPDDHTGFHKVFDYEVCRELYAFNARESGDAMALNPEGMGPPYMDFHYRFMA
jgi:hypothetical protein